MSIEIHIIHYLTLFTGILCCFHAIIFENRPDFGRLFPESVWAKKIAQSRSAEGAKGACAVREPVDVAIPPKTARNLFSLSYHPSQSSIVARILAPHTALNPVQKAKSGE